MKIRSTLLALALTSASSFGAVVYSEAASGDLSGAFGSPTAVVLSNGANTISGSIGNNGGSGATNGSDADYFTFNVAAGSAISAITIDAYAFSPNDPGVSFLGYTEDSAFFGQTGGDIAGSAFIEASSGDILPGLAGGPLGPGSYSFWLQETSANVVDYQLTITQVPEPGSVALFSIAALGFVLHRRR